MLSLIKQLDNCNDFFSKIKKTTSNLYGQKIGRVVDNIYVYATLECFSYTFKFPTKKEEREEAIQKQMVNAKQEIEKVIIKQLEDIRTTGYNTIGNFFNFVDRNKIRTLKVIDLERLSKLNVSADTALCSVSFAKKVQKKFGVPLQLLGIPLTIVNHIGTPSCYFLNSKDFQLDQLCDWQWLNDKKTTIVKYAVITCNHPQEHLKITLEEN